MAGAWRRGLGRLLVDTRPLRESRDFRLLFSGQVVSQIGNQLRMVALPYQVYLITHSPGMVGVLSLVQFLPSMVVALVAGAVADAADRRTILLGSQLGQLVTSSALAVLAWTGTGRLWGLFLIAGLAAAFQAFENPARRAAIPRMVERSQVTAAMALNQVLNQLSSVLGPALGGVLIAALGLGVVYSLDACSFLAVLAAVWRMSPIPPELAEPSPAAAAPLTRGESAGVAEAAASAAAPALPASIRTGSKTRAGQRLPRAWRSLASGLQRIAEGFVFLRAQPVLLAAFLIDLDATFFGSPVALFPALADSTFHVGAAGLGLLYAAPAVGALVCALASGWVSRVYRQGLAVAVMVLVWGAGITAFGLLDRWFWLALLMLAVAGAADMVSAILRSTILQITVPDRLRGRLSALYFIFISGGPRLGDVEAGWVAQWTSAGFSVVSGGLAAALGALWVVWRFPAFRRFDARTVGEPATAG
ncbi:MAG: MFS transporter [Alicyclobacillus sp.]|nr:MFS transporter [Alicyclobacillus sp.]